MAQTIPTMGGPAEHGHTPPVLAAHSRNDSGLWHSLADHLVGTGRRAGAFGEAFGSADACRLVGELHDLGKADPAWQRYLAAADAGNKLSTVDHKHAGAFLCTTWGLGTFAPVIVGHHGGIPDATDVGSRMGNEPTVGQQAAIDHVETLGLTRPEAQALIPPQFRPGSRADAVGMRRMEFWLRMVFSALVDADRLDTEEHFRGGRWEFPQPLGLSALDDRCEARRKLTLAERQHDPVTPARTAMFGEVTSKASAPPGWFELTAPTGSGKTIAALAFALRHANVNRLRRVVTAVPFVSVTEQVANVYRTLLDDGPGAPVVLEHHTGVFARGESQSGTGLWSRLAAENWDATVIVTTTVQLLESLFGNNPSRTRKLHRLARSVIVLDEVQSFRGDCLTQRSMSSENSSGCTDARLSSQRQHSRRSTRLAVPRESSAEPCSTSQIGTKSSTAPTRTLSQIGSHGTTLRHELPRRATDTAGNVLSSLTPSRMPGRSVAA